MNRSIIFGAIIISTAILVNGFLERRAHIVPNISASATSIPPDHVVAVLPFTSSDSADPNNSFAAGLEREIVTGLTRQHIKAASVQEAPPRGEILLGSIQRAGNRVRISVQLVDAASKVPRWAGTYDRELTDVFALQSEIAENVAKAVAAQKT